MSTQQPVRYENYPPDDHAGVDGSARTAMPRPYLPAAVPPPPPGRASRRTVIGLFIGIPVAAIILSATTTSDRSDADGSDDEYADGSYDPDGSGSFGAEFSVGDHTATAPAGWVVHDDGSGTVEVTNAANRLTAAGVDTATPAVAVDEILRLATPHYAGFSGRIGDPVDRSSADLQHATMDGAGKYNGEAARLMVELWIDGQGSGLLVTRVLTAKVASAIAVQAQEMLEELSGDF